MAEDFYQDVNCRDKRIITITPNIEKMETWRVQQISKKMVMPAEENETYTDFQALPYKVVSPKVFSSHDKPYSKEVDFDTKQGLHVQERKILKNVRLRLPDQETAQNKGFQKIVPEEPQLIVSPQSPGSTRDLDLKGKKKLEPHEGQNVDVDASYPADSKEFDLKPKPALKRQRQDTCDHLVQDFERVLGPEEHKVNTKQEANEMIQRINTCVKVGHPELIRQQSLTFDVNLNRRKLFYQKEIGCGSFGQVSLYSQDKRLLVLKKLPPRGKKIVVETNEVLLPLEFANTGLFPKVFGLEWNGREAVIIQEYAGVSLAHKLGDPGFCNRLDRDEQFGARIMLQIFRGQEELHKQGVVHRDFKIENITMDANERVYIIDFGSARTLQDKYIPETYTGSTPECLPPAVSHNIVNKVPLVERAMLNEASDVWGGGMIAASLLRKGHAVIRHFVGQPDYPDPNLRMPTLAKLAELRDPLPESIVSHPNHPILEQLIRGCLKVDEKFRWTAQQAVSFLEDKLSQNRCDGEPRFKKMRRLNDRDKLEMQAQLNMSGFNKVEVPDCSYQILGIQKRTADAQVFAGPNPLNIVSKSVAPLPVAAPPPRMFSGHRKILPKVEPQGTDRSASQSPNLQIEQEDLEELENFFYQKKPMMPAGQHSVGAFPLARQIAASGYQNPYGIASSAISPSDARPGGVSTYSNFASTSGGRVILQASPSPPIAAPTGTPLFKQTKVEERNEPDSYADDDSPIGNVPNFFLM